MAELTITIEEVRALSNLVLGVSGSATPTKTEQIINPTGEEVGFGIFECAAIPAEYIKPEGAAPSELSNGEQYIAEYKTATRTRTTGLFHQLNLAGAHGDQYFYGIKKLRKMPYLSATFTDDVYLPDCERVMSRAFSGSPIREVKLANCKIVDASAFEDADCVYVYLYRVQKIGAGAFRNSGLTGLNLSKVTKVPSLAVDAFDGCAHLANIYVPSSLVDAFKVAPVWSQYESLISA